jgi:hypothetical protein
MMASPQYSKTKGREWENDVVGYLARNGFPYAERRRLAGASDKGDIAGIPGVVIECKHERSYKLPEWVREAEAETTNAGANFGVVWARQNGKPGAENGFIIMTPSTLMHLLKEAGYLS